MTDMKAIFFKTCKLVFFSKKKWPRLSVRKFFRYLMVDRRISRLLLIWKHEMVFWFIVTLKTVQIKRKREKEKLEWLLKLKTAFIYFFRFSFFSFNIYVWQVHIVPQKNILAQLLLAINPLGNLLMSKLCISSALNFAKKYFNSFYSFQKYAY